MNRAMNKQVRARVKKSALHQQGGFTLLEALIGFLVLSIGMLGIASLQVVSLKAGKTSLYSSVAMMKVEELFESMRANPTETALAAYVAAGAGSGANNGCSSGTECSDTAMAQDDIFWWKKNLASGMPGVASTSITWVAPAPPSKMAVVTIEVKWDERDKDAESAIEKTYSTTANICTENPC